MLADHIPFMVPDAVDDKLRYSVIKQLESHMVSYGNSLGITSIELENRIYKNSKDKTIYMTNVGRAINLIEKKSDKNNTKYNTSTSYNLETTNKPHQSNGIHNSDINMNITPVLPLPSDSLEHKVAYIKSFKAPLEKLINSDKLVDDGKKKSCLTLLRFVIALEKNSKPSLDVTNRCIKALNMLFGVSPSSSRLSSNLVKNTQTNDSSVLNNVSTGFINKNSHFNNNNSENFPARANSSLLNTTPHMISNNYSNVVAVPNNCNLSSDRSQKGLLITSDMMTSSTLRQLNSAVQNYDINLSGQGHEIERKDMSKLLNSGQCSSHKNNSQSSLHENNLNAVAKPYDELNNSTGSFNLVDKRLDSDYHGTTLTHTPNNVSLKLNHLNSNYGGKLITNSANKVVKEPFISVTNRDNKFERYIDIDDVSPMKSSKKLNKSPNNSNCAVEVSDSDNDGLDAQYNFVQDIGKSLCSYIPAEDDSKEKLKTMLIEEENTFEEGLRYCLAESPELTIFEQLPSILQYKLYRYREKCDIAIKYLDNPSMINMIIENYGNKYEPSYNIKLSLDICIELPFIVYNYKILSMDSSNSTNSAAHQLDDLLTQLFLTDEAILLDDVMVNILKLNQ